MDVSIHFKGGGTFVSHPPLFSQDTKSVFVCWKNSILEYNTKTGKLAHEFRGSDRIIGFNCHLYKSNECLTACLVSGKVIVWKALTRYKILEQQLPVKRIKTFSIISSDDEEDLAALVSYSDKKCVRFAYVDVNKKTWRDYNFSIKLDDQKYYYDISRNKYFSVVQGNAGYFVKFNEFRNISRYFIQESRKFTCIACHPTEEVVLTGDNTGRVVVWQNLLAKEKTEAVFHWHTLPVRTVCFSTVGSYFYSGGEECVLVRWQFNNSNDRMFVPRIAAILEHISVANNNLYVAVATSDNAVRIFDSRMNQATLIQHLVLGKQYQSGIVYDPRTKALIMNGNQGQVQFYSPSDMSLLYNVDIVGQNRITNERDCIIQNIEITKVAISKGGEWLGTVEERIDQEYHSEIRLKFWKFNDETQIFSLNTSIEYPHDSSITSIQFQPLNNDGELRCVTVGNDKKFKVWQLTEVTTVYNKSPAWKCSGAASFRGLPCAGLSFSADGSLVAVGFDAVLTAWSPDACQLKCSLLRPGGRQRVRHVQFGRGDQCHLVAAASTDCLSVWNLLTLSMVWTVPVRVGLLVADALTTLMAVFTEDRTLIVFSPASPDPIYLSHDLLKNQKAIVASTFIPSKFSNDNRLPWHERSHLYFINSDNEIFCIGTGEYIVDPAGDMENREDKSIFSKTLSVNQSSLVQRTAKHELEHDGEHRSVKKYLEAPVHTMAPIRFMCYSLLKSLVIQKDAVR